jgi:hypothetical protein
METKVEKYSKEEKVKFVLFKDYIKTMADEQRFLKNQRKTEKIVGERKMPAWEATYKHQSNREKLRVLYAAYGVLRGKSYSEIENHYDEENHPLKEYDKAIEKVLIEHKFLKAE